MEDKIITARDRYGSVQKMVRRLSKVQPDSWQPRGAPVTARVNLGRWLADCECGGAELVDPADRVFYCCSCHNAANDGAVRPVKFPHNHQQVERELLKRKGRKIGTFIYPQPGELPREWIPGETAYDLHRQRESVR